MAHGLESEWRAVREGAGWIALADRAELSVTGADRVKFIHGQSTADVRRLTPGGGALALFLSPKGKLRFVADLFVAADELLLASERAAASALLEHLRKHAVFDKVTLAAAPPRETVSVQGPAAAAALARLLGNVALPVAPRSHGEITLAGESIGIAAIDRTGSGGWDLSGPAGLGERLSAAGVCAVGAEAAETLRIEAGLPRWGVDMDESHLPNEVGLTSALSYTKGCYTGQETIARIKTYGHVNRSLAAFAAATDGAIDLGEATPIDAEGPPAHVTSATFSPALGRHLALGLLPRGGESRRYRTAAGIEIEPIPAPHPARTA